MNAKQLISGAVLGAAAIASPAVVAGEFEGNVSAVSTYMFRGVDRSVGAAVQGGVDYTFDFGMYTGLWVSNALGTSTAWGGNEADVYAGYGLKLGGFTLDGGVIYYAFTEDTENFGAGGANVDYAEVYLGGGFGPAALKVFYAPEFGPDQGGTISGDIDKNELLYVTASANLELTNTIAFIPQIGFSSGDGAKDAFGDEYSDYSVTAVKKLKDDFSVSLAVVGSSLELAPGRDDAPKFVIGLKKKFKV